MIHSPFKNDKYSIGHNIPKVYLVDCFEDINIRLDFGGNEKATSSRVRYLSSPHVMSLHGGRWPCYRGPRFHPHSFVFFIHIVFRVTF